MSAYTGTAALARFTVRRDWVRILLWVIAIAFLVVFSALQVASLFPTEESLRNAAALIEGSTAEVFFNGPAQAVDTVGGQVAFQLGSFTFMVAGLMSLFMVSRLTRAEEESGRTELVLATRVGRYAPSASALVVVAAMNVIAGLVVTLGLLSQNLEAMGSVAFGAAFTATGLVFAGIAAVAAQLSPSARVASGVTGAVLAVSFIIRAIGDVGNGALSWLSPLGWPQKMRAFAGEQWWPLALMVIVAAVLLAVAAALVAHRDVGAGLIPPRPGPAEAGAYLGRPVGLAWRLQRATILWWSVGLLVTGIAYGSVADEIDEFIKDNESMREMMLSAGAANLTDAFFSTSFLQLAVATGGFALQATLRLRSEEVGQRAEPILTAPVSRPRWVRSHLMMSFGGSAAVLAAGGFGTGAVYGLVIGDLSQAWRLTAAALVQVPAVWVLIGVAVALFGIVPRATVAAWSVLGAVFFIGFFGTLLKLPAWLLNLSPYEHTPQVPAESFKALPLVLLTAVAVALAGAGVVGFQRRDVG